MSIDLRKLARTDKRAFNAIRRDYQKRHRTFPKVLTKMPAESWPTSECSIVPDECWNSQAFFVQVFKPEGQPIRISVCRTVLASDGSWMDGITWDEMMHVKESVGFGDAWAVEIFPPINEVVNVANFRHLWIVPAPEFAWRRKSQPKPEPK